MSYKSEISFRVDITHSRNHWSNEELVIFLLKKIVISFIKKKRKALKFLEESVA